MTLSGMGDRKRTIESADTLAATVSAEESAETAFDAPRPVLADRYELLGFLGAGGMGAVYRVRDKELGEIVALKMLRPELSRNASALERFRREVTIARRVTHDNVARTFDIGDHRGEKFLTMECVDGGSLAARIGEEGALAEREVVDVGAAICAGLAAAHRAGVVHRDLKPENVLFAKDGRVVVTDFGIAHAGEGRDSAVIGTPAYMAPEQLTAGPVDLRADIYALGAVLFEMATGQAAWSGDSAMQLLAKRSVATAPPDPRAVRAAVGDSLRAITMKCMAAAPADRYASADDVAVALKSAATAPLGSTPAEDMPRPTRAGKTVAVLPLANEGAESDQYIADGLTGDIIDALSMTRGLLVRPRAVVTRVRTSDRTLEDIARELSVQVIVEGSIRRAADRIRLGVRVIGAEDGFQLWANRFDTSLEDLLVTGDAAARAIADVLTTQLPEVATSGVHDAVAIDLYLRAKETFWRNWHDSAIEAVAQFERALALAPSDPKILAGTAQAMVRMLFFGEGDRAAVLARSRELTERAVVVAPDLGDTWAALAAQRLNAGDAVGAARTLRSGLERAPNSAMLQDMVGRMFAEVTPIEEGIARLEIALGLDPTMMSARWELSRVLALRGEYERSDALVTQESSPAILAHRGRTALWRGEKFVVESAGPGTYAQFYTGLDRDKDLTDAQRAFLTERERNSVGRIRTLRLQRNAEVYAFVRDRENALSTIEKAIEADLIDVAWLDHCPLFEDLRTDPRFGRSYATLAARASRIRLALRAPPNR